jgi:hypothetical protein
MSATKRPTGITITAWLWIVIGALMLLSSVMAGFAYSTMRSMNMPPPSEVESGFAAMDFFFRNFLLVLGAQGVLSFVAVCAGIALLRLRSWGRTAIYVLSWIAFLYTVGFGVFWLYMWISMTGQATSARAQVGAASFQWMGAAMGAIITAVFAAPLWVMIRYLRGIEVRTAIANAYQSEL